MLVDLIAARIDIGFTTWAAAKEYIKDGKLRLLAIASPKRWASAGWRISWRPIRRRDRWRNICPRSAGAG